MKQKPSKDARKIADALTSLRRRINEGQEFPDACFTVSVTHNVHYKTLQDAYDSDGAE